MEVIGQLQTLATLVTETAPAKRFGGPQRQSQSSGKETIPDLATN